MILSTRKITAIALFFVAPVLFLLFANVQVASAQLCDGSGLSGSIKVTGPKGCAVPTSPCGVKGGTAGCPCTVAGTGGGSIKAICSATKPCCERVSETSADSAIKDATQGLGSQLGSGLGGGIMEQLMGMLQKMMGGSGGGSGGGGGDPYNSDENTPAEDNLLAIDPNLLSDENLGLDNLIFGATDTTTTNTEDTTGTVVNNDTGGEDNTNTGTTAGDNAPAQEGDTVETTYENLETVGENPIVGDSIQSDTYVEASDDEVDLFSDPSNFDEDFFGANLDYGDGTTASGGLSQLQLEAQGLLEAARLGASNDTHSGSLTVPYESLTPAEITSLQDYHSSAVAVSGGLSPFTGNPLSNEQYNSGDESGEGAQQGTGFFQKIANFLASLLGLGAPQN